MMGPLTIRRLAAVLRAISTSSLFFPKTVCDSRFSTAPQEGIMNKQYKRRPDNSDMIQTCVLGHVVTPA